MMPAATEICVHAAGFAHPPVRHVTVPSPDATKSLMDCILSSRDIS